MRIENTRKKKRRILRFMGFVPFIFIAFVWYTYCYGVSHPEEGIGILVSNIVSSYNSEVSKLSSLLVVKSDKGYLENIALVEEEDVERVEKEKAEIRLLNAKNGVADLNNWVLPIVGNYTITTYYGASHRGIDYYSYNGYDSDIRSANNGVVYSVNTGCYAGNSSCNGGRGNYIVINHNNGDYYTMYMHLHNVYVNVDDVVSATDVIGSMGNTGYVIPLPSSYNPYGGVHLHFEVYRGIPDRGGYTINPLSLY
jgi:murein DD-endopeptidase MepM/ murein hydrolase activator NlpD